MIAGVGSGCGKTTAVCGILYGLKKLGLSVQAFKSGPDYIDPMFHKKVLGTEGGNLDLFFSGEDGVRCLLAEGMGQRDIAIVEGAMGYYDGIGMTEAAGCHALAQAAGLPVVLVVDPAGMGLSVCAMIQGFLRYRQPSAIRGILLNRVSRTRYETLKPFVEKLGVSVLGYIPVQTDLVLESRHLGLVTADEIEGFLPKLERFYNRIRHTIHWELLLGLAAEAPPVLIRDNRFADEACNLLSGDRDEKKAVKLRIGIARDEAFCFLYEENLRYLERRGCEPVFFSPLRDKGLPAGLDGLILCGGYPELYAGSLSENTGMRSSVREAVAGGMPCIAECGGFLYLQTSMTDHTGAVYEMAGVLPGRGCLARGLKRFGYIELTLEKGRLFGLEKLSVHAHEFHYCDCSEPGSDFLAKKASGAGSWQTGVAADRLYAGFPHIYFRGNEAFAEGFLAQAGRYKKQMEAGKGRGF